MTPQLTHSPTGVWYLLLEDRPVVNTVPLHPNLHLDLDADNRLVGIEGLGSVQFPTDTPSSVPFSVPDEEGADVLPFRPVKEEDR